jgi:hypothetical protein
MLSAEGLGKKVSTTTILVNEVSMMSTAGRKDRKLIMRNISITGLSMSLKSKACAGAAMANSITNTARHVLNIDLLCALFKFLFPAF